MGLDTAYHIVGTKTAGSNYLSWGRYKMAGIVQTFLFIFLYRNCLTLIQIY